MPRVTSLSPSHTDEDSEAQKGPGSQQHHTAADAEAPCCLLRSQGLFPLGHGAMLPQGPPPGVTMTRPRRAFPFAAPVCGQDLGLRSRKPGGVVVRDR